MILAVTDILEYYKVYHEMSSNLIYIYYNNKRWRIEEIAHNGINNIVSIKIWQEIHPYESIYVKFDDFCDSSKLYIRNKNILSLLKNI